SFGVVGLLTVIFLSLIYGSNNFINSLPLNSLLIFSKLKTQYVYLSSAIKLLFLTIHFGHCNLYSP
ncbi:hypothetical protein, partial [Borreliella garinii]|uniref:hypothetical protein n=1 Tax=Borreliella garinii TaxID=29519 RepID=UPI001AEFFEF5